MTLRAVSSLTPYVNNARKHSADQVAKIAASIRRFGFNNPVLVDAAGTIVAGHGRMLAAKQLGLREIPVVELGHLTDDERRAYTIADNRIGEDAEWDMDMLARELEALGTSGDAALVALTGFDDGEMSRILARLQAGAAPDGQDDAPPAPAVPISMPGDLWLLGPHRVICGDSTRRADVSRVLAGAVPLLMVTDPPYGVEYDPDWRNRTDRDNGEAIGGRAIGQVRNDDRSDWREAYALFPGDVAYVWHSSLSVDVFAAGLRASGFDIRAHIVWVKTRPVISRGHYHWQHEAALFAERGADEPPHLIVDHESAEYAVRVGRTANWHGDRRQSTVWMIDHLKSETGHSTQKPVECMRRPILNNSALGQLIYDPFLGSGTTLIAAELTGRACAGLELSPAYVDVIVRRWQLLAGGVAMLEGDGRSFAAVAADRARVAA